MVRASLFGEAAPPRIGRFEIRGKLGQGGMAVVLRAYDDTLDREVALKLLHRERQAKHGPRLRREARALARLSHPNVVQVYEVGEIDDQTFIAMELVDGQTLARWQRRARPWRECVEIYRQAGRGLAAAHARELIHRDFKPANCILDESGRVRVLDFGLVRHVLDTHTAVSTQDNGSSVDVPHSTPDDRRPLAESLTDTGSIMGTLAYMAPEQAREHVADALSDQFSFCVSLYEAIYGERPFQSDGAQVMAEHAQDLRVRPAPTGIVVPERLRRALLRGLSLRSSERWPSMQALLDELGHVVAPRRWRWLAFAGALGLGGAGLGLAQYAAVGFRCDGAEAMLDGIWDDARHRDVRAAVLGTQIPYAPKTLEKVEPHLDAYARDWITTHVEACEATRVAESQTEEVMELRMACLSRRRTELRQVVDLLAVADGTTVENAVPLVASLPSLARCNDVDALRAALPPPEDPALVEPVEALREQLSRATALRIAGRLREGREEADAVVEIAGTLDYAPMRAEAWLERGMARMALHEFGASEQDLRRAYVEAAQLGHLAVESASASALTDVVGSRLERPSEGMVWGTTALALARHAHADPGDEAQALHSIGMVLVEKGEWEDAREHWERAVAIWTGLHGPEHVDVASTLGAIAMARGDMGELSEAIEGLERALALMEEVQGPQHPEIATMLANMGAFYYRQGDYASAVAHLERSLAIEESVLGPSNPSLVRGLGFLGNAFRQQGENETALVHLRRAVAIGEDSPDLDPGSFAQAINGVGVTLYGMGETEEGIRMMSRALAVIESSDVDQGQELPVHLFNLATVLFDQGRLDESQARYEQGVSVTAEALGAEHPMVSAPLAGLADVALARGDPAAALHHAERSLAIRESHEVPPNWRARSRFLVAQALPNDPGSRARARALAQQAHETYVELGPQTRAAADKIHQWLEEHPEL